MPKNKQKTCVPQNERKMKRTREGSSQTDEAEIFEDDSHDCQKCKLTNSRLIEIDEKPNRLLKLMPELETYMSRVKSLEDEQKSMARQGDKAFIKSFIKNLKKGRSLGISDDFPKEVEDIRK